MELPKVSIVIANLNGKHHLRECFGSIKKLRYPSDKVEVVVVDNGSTDGSAEFISEGYGWVKLIRNSKNEGFAKPSNDGARAASGDCVAFLNNDMRVEPDWLIELIRSMERAGAMCAGSVILNWDGKYLDFAGGGVNFLGLGYQDDFARPMSEMEPLLKEDRELLFACGGSMIVDREAFLSAGGFDEDYFAYYEDADLGWRLNVLGYKTVLSVRSRVFHKHNSTSKTIRRERIQYLFERNKLYTCYKNYGDDLLNRVFFPSLLLGLRETYMESGIDGFNYNIKNPGAFDPDPVQLGGRAAMKLAAYNEFCENLPAMSAKRAFIQNNRREKDVEIAKLVGQPFIIFPSDSGEYLNAEYDVVKAFGMDKLLGHELKTRVLVVAGKKENAERGLALAGALSGETGLEVTAALPEGVKAAGAAVAFGADPTALLEAVRTANVVVLAGPLPEGVGPQREELTRAVGKKYVAADLQSLENGADPDKAYSALADFYIRSEESEKEFSGPEKSGDTAALAGFCRAPRHSKSRLETAIPFAEEETPAALMEDAAVDVDGASISEQLRRIERREEELSQMMVAQKRLLKETRADVGELGSWSQLMERRFFKLKHKLGRIRFLRRFVG